MFNRADTLTRQHSDPSFSEMKSALIEWQEARRVLFSYPMKANADEEQKAIWNRLAEAEDKLMRL